MLSFSQALATLYISYAYTIHTSKQLSITSGNAAVLIKSWCSCWKNRITFKRTRSVSNAVCTCHNFLKYLTCNFDDLELALFNVIQCQRSWCQSKTAFSVSYLTSIVSNIVSLVVFEISDAEVLRRRSRTVQGHPRSNVTVPIDSSWTTSYSTSVDPNIVSVTVFEIFDLQFWWPWTKTVQSHLESRIMVPR